MNVVRLWLEVDQLRWTEESIIRNLILERKDSTKWKQIPQLKLFSLGKEFQQELTTMGRYKSIKSITRDNILFDIFGCNVIQDKKNIIMVGTIGWVQKTNEFMV